MFTLINVSRKKKQIKLAEEKRNQQNQIKNNDELNNELNNEFNENVDFNTYKIFKWNSNIGITNYTNNYKNILVHTGSRRINEWQNCLACKYINNKLHIIMNSNSYYIEDKHSNEANQLYKMYDNIIKNYLDVTRENKIINTEYYNDNKYFFMMDSFAFSNSGHNLSDFLNKVDYIIKNKIRNIVIYEGYKETNNYKLIELLLPECVFYELSMNTIYNFKNIIIILPLIYNITLHKNIIDNLREIIINKYSKLYDECKYKNIILMKTHLNKNVMLQSSQFNCPQFINLLETNGFINIIPENVDIYKLCIYLLFANKIVFSTGSVLYTNKIFFNNNAKLIYIIMKKKHKDGCCAEELLNKNPKIIHTDKNIRNATSIVNEIVNY